MRSGGPLSTSWRAGTLLLMALLTITACSGGGLTSATEQTPSTAATTPDGRGAASDAEIWTNPCSSVDPSTWSPTATETDLAAEISAGTAPHPTEAGGDIGPPADSATYATPDDFLAQSNVPDPEARRTVMVDAGFAGGLEAIFPGDRPAEIQVLAFRDSAGAIEYFRARLPNICAVGGTQAGVNLLDDTGGITWTDPRGATHGEFILGRYQVSLLLCECDDPQATSTVRAWHDEWRERYGAG